MRHLGVFFDYKHPNGRELRRIGVDVANVAAGLFAKLEDGKTRGENALQRARKSPPRARALSSHRLRAGRRRQRCPNFIADKRGVKPLVHVAFDALEKVAHDRIVEENIEGARFAASERLYARAKSVERVENFDDLQAPLASRLIGGRLQTLRGSAAQISESG